MLISRVCRRPGIKSIRGTASPLTSNYEAKCMNECNRLCFHTERSARRWLHPHSQPWLFSGGGGGPRQSLGDYEIDKHMPPFPSHYDFLVDIIQLVKRQVIFTAIPGVWKSTGLFFVAVKSIGLFSVRSQ